MLVPQVEPPFPLAWGFSTRFDPAAELPPVRLSQVHGCGIVEAFGAVQEGDGLWTMNPGERIGVRVADCVPILLAGWVSGHRPWVAALHAGWRGAVAGILRRGIEGFQGLGGIPEDLTWALGPAIQKCHFDVGPEVIVAARLDPACSDDLVEVYPDGNPHFDLSGFLNAQAKGMGLDPRKDGSIALCTMCQTELLWSYRRGDTSDRQWGWIGILPH